MNPGQSAPRRPRICDVVVFTDIIMNDIFDDVQYNEYEKREHEYIECPFFEILPINKFKHTIVYSRIVDYCIYI